MHYVYLIVEEIGLSLVPGQLMPLVRFLKSHKQLDQKGTSVRCLAVVSLRDYLRPGWRQRIRQRFVDQLTQESLQITFIPKLSMKIVQWFVNVFAKYHGLTSADAKVVWHCRGPVATEVARKHCSIAVGNNRVLFDVRGATPEEWLYVGGYGRANYQQIAEQLFQSERESLCNADSVLFVTNELKEHMSAIHGDPPSRSTVVPCYLDIELLENKIPYSKPRNENIEYFYSGSAAKWQQIDRVFSCFKRVWEKQPCAKLTVLTPHMKAMFEKLAKQRLPAGVVKISNLPPQEVLVAYRSATFGFLLREDHLINNVAFPVKFAEYLYMGVIPIISASLKSCVGIVEKHEIGIVVPGDFDVTAQNELIDQIQHLTVTSQLSAMQQRCHDIARRHLGFDCFKHNLEKVLFLDATGVENEGNETRIG